jgi:multiple antibiotic resistance protein
VTRELLGALGLALAALLPIINPIGNAPIFLSLTPDASDEDRAVMARRIAINSTLLLVAVMAGGSHVLVFFGLSLPVIQIAGGLLVVANGWRLLTADDSHAHSADAKLVDTAQTRIFLPLTFPLTVGPGTISVAIAVSANTRAPAQVAGVLVGIVVAGLSIYWCYRYASRVIHLLGDTGSVVFLRLAAFILLSIGVQILTDGIVGRFHLEPLMK